MTYSYFPGCTLKNKAKDLDHYARECAKVLGFELEEIENWQCCGAVYPQASDEIATKLSSVRALADAKEKGQDLITVCSACHHVIKRVNDDMANVEDIQTKVNNYMALSEPYLGETKVLHYLEVLRDVVGFDKIKEKVVNPLKGRKIGAYYGCMLLRPSTTMQFDDPENPTISPPSTSSAIPPHVPTRINVSAPHWISSSIAMEADGPPMPVDVTETFTPSKVPV